MANDLTDVQRNFLQTYSPLAKDIAARTGLDPSVVLGQIAQETGWGAHVQGNNIFGISPGGNVANYPTVEDAAHHYVDLIRSRYGAAAAAPNPDAQASQLVAGGYNTADPGYATKVAQNARSVRAAGAPAAMPDEQLDEFLKSPPQPSTASPVSPPAQSEADLDAFLRGNQSSNQPPGKPGETDPLTGRPFQFASTASGPVAESLNKPIVENRVPGAVTQAVTNLATDPDARRRLAASQLFPDLAPTEAQSRVFFGPNGRLAAVDRSGTPFYVDPEPPSISLSGGARLGNPLSYVASSLPAAMAPGAGLLAGAAAAPGSLIVGPLAAAGGAAAGDLARQSLARWFDPASQPINLSQTAREAALSGAGQFGGAVVANALAPNVLRLSPSERRIMATPVVMNDTRAAYARAAAQGVDLTPGQATGLPSLLQYEDAATTLPGTVDQATGFYRNQGNQLQAAGQNMLSSVSPIADKTDAARAFQGGAEDAIRLARQNANQAARPFYNAAQEAGQAMSPDLAQLVDQPAVASAMDSARKAYQNLYRKAPPDTPDFALWDLTKRKLDDAFNVAQRAGERTDAMAIDTLRGDLTQHLDAAYPAYATARATAAPGQALASRLEESGVGTVADKTGDERARAIVAPVFSQNNPRAISQARDAFSAAGRSDEWNAGVRSYLQDAIDKAGMSQQGLNPSMLRRQVWSNVDNRDAVKAALTPAQYQGFDNFLSTIEDAARTYPMNSLTATRLNARGTLQGAAESQGNVRALDAAATVLSPFSWGNLGVQALSGVRQRMIGNNVQRIVSHLFSPDGLQYLEAMSAYRPGTLRAIEAASQIVARAAPTALSGPAANENSLSPAQSANPLQLAR